MTNFGPECFHRHAFVRVEPSEPLSPENVADAPALRSWVEAGRPLIVRHPCLSADGEEVYAGVTLPPSPIEHRIALRLSRANVREIAEPPLWDDCAGSVGRAASDAVAPVRAAAEACGAKLRALGSHAWQHLTGLSYLAAGSNIDLLLTIYTRRSWETLRRNLEPIFLSSWPRVDLEIALCDDASFPWREFAGMQPRLIFRGNSNVWMGEKSDVAGYLRD